MLLSLGLILLCQLVGEAIARGTGIPVPGPVLGLLLCVLLLAGRDAAASRAGRLVPEELADGTFETTGHGILRHLSMLFVPAGVGVVQRLDVLAENAGAIALAILVSTALALAVTAWVFVFVSEQFNAGPQRAGVTDPRANPVQPRDARPQDAPRDHPRPEQ